MKTQHTTILIIILISSSIIYMPNFSRGGSSPPPDDIIDGLLYIDGDWYVDDYRNYSNEIIVLTGNLTVNATGVLEFVNVTLRMNVTGSCGDYHIEIRDGGHFYVNDTDGDNTTKEDKSIITNSEIMMHGYLFQVNKSAIFEMRNSMVRKCGLLMNQPDADKTGLRILSESIVMENCDIKNGANGIVADSSNITLENCTLRNNKYNGIYYLNDTITSHHFNVSVSNCNISDNRQSGILVESPSVDIELLNNLIQANENGGVLVVGGQSINATIIDNHIRSNFEGGGVGLWGTPNQCVIRANFTGNNISENEGIAPIRVGFESLEPPAKSLYVNITNNDIWKSSWGDEGAIMLFAKDYILANISHNEVIIPQTQNGVHIGKVTTEISTQPGCKVVEANVANNNITNIAAGALRICAIENIITNITGNHIYNSNALMTCGAVSVGWFKVGTADTTPNNATIILKNNIFEGMADSGAVGVKAVYNLNTTFENNTVTNVDGWGIRLGWLDDDDANKAPELWAYPTRNVRAKINNNSITGGRGPGIWLYSSDGSKVFFNTITSRTGLLESTSKPGDGIRIQSTMESAKVFSNTISNCTAIGLRTYNTSSSSVYDNDFDNNLYGIGVDYFSKQNVLFNNTITKPDNKYGFYINTNSLNHTIPVNNTVNGERLQYFFNLCGTPLIHKKVENLEVQEPLMANLGQIIIANSTYVDIMNNSAAKGSYGLSLIDVDNSTIINNTAIDNTPSPGYGIHLQTNSNDNIIKSNDIQNNGYGIGLASSSVGNHLWENTISKSSTQRGLYLEPGGSTWDNEIPINNTVEGTSIRYYYQVPQLLLEDLNISTSRMTNLGQIILVDCSNVTLRDLQIMYGLRGAYIHEGDNISVINSILSLNDNMNFYSIGSSNLTFKNVTTSQGIVNYYLSSVENVSLENCILLNGTNSIWLISTSPQITNTTIGDVTNCALSLTDTSQPILLNTTFNKTSVNILSDSTIIVKWYLHVKADCNNHTLEGANVMVKNETTVLYDVITDSDGQVRDLVLTEYLNTTDNITYYSPYNLNVTKTGFGEFNMTLPMEETTEVIAVLDDGLGPGITEGPYITPNVTSTSTNTVWLNATIDDQSTGNSIIPLAEWIESPTYPLIINGSGNAMNTTDGAFDETNETLSVALNITYWEKGNHTLWVHGKDVVDNWGEWVQATLTMIDDEGPIVTIGPTVQPNPINRSKNEIWLNATINDSGYGDSNITAAEWSAGPAAAPEGNGTLMNPIDGTFDESTEETTTTIDIDGWEIGNYILWVRGQDSDGNWGDAISSILIINEGAGPLIRNILLTPNPARYLDTSTTLTAIVTETTGNNNIAYAEYSVGVSAAFPGTGTPMNPSDGSYDSPNEEVTAVIDISGWFPGSYKIWVTAKDTADNWGAPTSTTLVINSGEGPIVTGISVTPNPVIMATTTVELTATIDDRNLGDLDIATAEYSIGTVPLGPQLGIQMFPAVGTFDNVVEDVTATIDISGWGFGSYTLWVRGQDSDGNWGDANFVVLVINDIEAPSTPTGLTVIDLTKGGQLNLSWDANTEPDLAGYNIYRSLWSGSSYQLVETVDPDNTSWQDSGLDNGVTYYYVITAFDNASIPNESPNSEEVSATPTQGSSLWIIGAISGAAIGLAVIGLIYFIRFRGSGEVTMAKQPPKEQIEHDPVEKVEND